MFVSSRCLQITCILRVIRLKSSRLGLGVPRKKLETVHMAFRRGAAFVHVCSTLEAGCCFEMQGQRCMWKDCKQWIYELCFFNLICFEKEYQAVLLIGRSEDQHEARGMGMDGQCIQKLQEPWNRLEDLQNDGAWCAWLHDLKVGQTLSDAAKLRWEQLTRHRWLCTGHDVAVNPLQCCQWPKLPCNVGTVRAEIDLIKHSQTIWFTIHVPVAWSFTSSAGLSRKIPRRIGTASRSTIAWVWRPLPDTMFRTAHLGKGYPLMSLQ